MNDGFYFIHKQKCYHYLFAMFYIDSELTH